MTGARGMTGAQGRQLWRLAEMFPEQVAARLEEMPALVLPLGTIEWHSHHLPLGLDGIVAEGLCRGVAERTGAMLAPVSYWAVGGVPYPYTLTLPGAQVEPLLETVFEQLGAMGLRVIVGFTGHFGLDQTLSLKRAALAVMRRSPVTILPLTEYDLVTDTYLGDHAAVGETSLMQALRPDLVRLEAVEADAPLDGIIGAEPRGAASAERGQALAAAIVERTSEVLLRLVYDTSAVQRARYIEALQAGTRVVERLVRMRAELPKALVPALTTPAYVAFCQAIYAGDYGAAKAQAERKLAVLSE